MKRNLISILILALLVVNVVLTAIMMFSVAGAMKSTTALVSRIAAVLDLELNLETDGNELAMSDTIAHNIADSMTIPLKGSGEEQRYAVIAVSLQLDKTNKDYEKYAEGLLNNESLIKGEIIEVVSSHTLEEFQNDTDGIRNEILARLRKMYDSDFIYKVVFSDVKVY
ncbi:MAG: flagellar basal body-associated FliL family protein [Lachnospiraceae bacterium]|nr:flagellar basal body-associated FliL family protein [Lachnospiraceae bacterium]